MCPCWGGKGKYISLGTCSLVVEHGERTSTWQANQGMLYGDNAGPSLLGLPHRSSSPPSQLPEPPFQSLSSPYYWPAS